MQGDHEIGIPIAGGDEDTQSAGPRDAIVHREIGELLLRVDELEDTLRVMEEQPATDGAGPLGSPPDTVQRLHARIRSERARIEELESRGPLQYDDIERAIRLSDRMG